ncbi:succinyl-diaminopimelate desuccinylase [Thermotomaculum hydrothermale]|uniref:Succinyl-diaminopimelate desuccinylase n=1 Tax=Thermotomaculum hydrothermale TaxID=981385 RepID=A0A7R6PGH4_9BACT|nr:M20 family metallopeptidase [Thermotomaculum hydrothermale]BBB33333.1 succinyl-diaminopimelate desuccinylase [Thermotomaculum hydrothermale]
MDEKAKIKAYFKENEGKIRDKIVSLVREMVKEKTVNVVSEKLSEHPYLKFRGEEYRVGNIVKREFEEHNIPYDEFARMEGRPNIIGKIGKDKNGKRLFMAAHMDIVPAGDGWDTDPFEVVEKDGKLYGRGTLDNKGPLASIIVAGEVLKELGIELEGELQLAALSDEEAEDPDGIDYGIGYLLEEKLINPTFAIIPDIGENMERIDIAEKGRTVFKVTAHGKQAHGSTPEKGINAVYMMAKMVCEIEKLKFDYTVHPVLGDPTLNLGEIHGGAAANIVPGQCEILLDIRTVPGMTKEQVIKKLEECAAKVEGGKFTIECMSWNEPHAVDPDNDLVKAIQINTKEVLGFEPEPFGMGGGTFAKTLNIYGVTAVGWGPGDDEAFHVANEYVEIKQLIDFALLTCLVAIDLLN